MSGSTDKSDSVLESIANPKQINLLGAYQGANDVARGIWANRQSQANQLAGQAQQGAIDPATGQYSPDKYRQNLAAAGPGAALAAQSGLAANQALSSDQLNQAKDKLAWVAKASGAALTQGDYSDAGMMKVLTQGSADGMLTMPEIVRQLSTLPADPAGRKAWLEQHQNQAMSTAQQLELRYGRPIIGDTGQAIVGGTQSPQTGALNIPPGQGVQKQTGPETNAAMVETYVENPQQPGTYIKVMKPRSALPGASGVVGNGVGDPNPLLGGLPNPPMNGAPAAAPLAAPPPGANEAVTSAASARGGQSATAFKEITDQAVAAKSRGAVLDDMLSDTGQFTTGPGADTIARLRAVAQRLGVPVNTEGLTAAESFNKLASQLNSSQGSDARLEVSKASNPHADLSPGGVDLMLRQLRGNEDYAAARARLAATYPDQADRSGFEAKVGAKLDPRTFQYDRMTPPQKATFFKSIADKEAFIKAHDAATALLTGGR